MQEIVNYKFSGITIVIDNSNIKYMYFSPMLMRKHILWNPKQRNVLEIFFKLIDGL
jgi:hypothetical protein